MEHNEAAKHSAEADSPARETDLVSRKLGSKTPSEWSEAVPDRGDTKDKKGEKSR